MTLTEALGRGAEFPIDATERALRVIVLGARLPGQAAVASAVAAPVSGTQRPSTVR